MGSLITRSFRSAQFDHWLHTPVKFLVLLIGLVLVNSFLFLTIGASKTFAYYYNYVVGNNSGACSSNIGGNNLIAVPITPSQDGVVNTVYVNTNNWYFNDNYVVGVYDASFHVLAKTSSVIPSTTNGYRPYYIPITSINLSGGQTYYIVLNMSVGSLCYPWPGTGGNYKIIGGYNYSDPLPDDLSSLSFTDVTDGANFDVALYDEIYPTLTPKIDPPSITPIPNNSVSSCQGNMGGNNLIAVPVTPSQNGTVSSIYVYTNNWYYTDNYVVGVYDASFHVLAKTSYTVPIQNSIGSTYIPINPFTVTNGATYWIIVNQSTGSLCYPWPGTGGNYKIIGGYNYSDPLPDTFPELNFRDVLDGANFDVDLYYQTNTPPSVASISSATVNEGDTYSYTGSFTDPDSTSWTGTIDYGDGGGSQALTLNSDKTFSLSHVYKEEGTYTVTVAVTDNQGATGTGTATITVNNAPFSLGAITVSANPVLVNTSSTASATFNDPGVLDTHTASWNWGDGNTTTGTVTETNGSGSVSDSHTYSAPGIYTISLTVTDDDGATQTATYQYLSAYATTTKSVAGAKEFASPAGAVIQNPSLTGTANFGFTAQYDNSGNVMPIGNSWASVDLKQQGKTDVINFVATSYQWLVVSGSKATLKGNGTYNGTAGYTVLVSAIDGGTTGSDYIRYQIKDPQGNVVYDTQPGAADTTDPTTQVTKGKITIK